MSVTNSAALDLVINSVWRGGAGIAAARRDLDAVTKQRQKSARASVKASKDEQSEADRLRAKYDEIIRVLSESESTGNRVHANTLKKLGLQQTEVKELSAAYTQLARSQKSASNFQSKIAAGSTTNRDIEGLRRHNALMTQQRDIINSVTGRYATMRAELDPTTGLLGKMGSAARGAGARLAGMGLLGWTGLVVGAGYAVTQLTQQIYDLGKSGAVVAQMESSFDTFRASVDGSQNLLNDLRAASRGTISEMDMMKNMFTLVAGSSEGVTKQFVANAPALLDVAKAAAKLNPELGDTEFMFQSLSRGIKRLEFRLLDNLGLNIKIAEANERYAASIGKTVQQLDQEEKTIALMNEVLRVGVNLTNQAGGSTESLVDPYERATAAAQNYGNELRKNIFLGLEYLGVLDSVANTLNRWAGIQNFDVDILPEEFNFDEQFRAAREELARFGSGLEAIEQTDELMRLIANEVNAIPLAYNRATIAQEAFAIILEDLKDGGLETGESLAGLADHAFSVATNSFLAAEAAKKMAVEVNGMQFDPEEAKQQAIAINEIALGYAAQSGVVDDATMSVARYMAQSGVATSELMSFISANSDMSDVMATNITVMSGLESRIQSTTDAHGGLDASVSDMIPTFHSLVDQFFESIDIMEANEQAAKDNQKAYEDQQLEIQKAEEEIGKYINRMIEQSQLLDDSQKLILDNAQALGKNADETINSAQAAGILTEEEAKLLKAIATTVAALRVAQSAHGSNSSQVATESAKVQELIGKYIQLAAVLGSADFSQSSISGALGSQDMVTLEEIQELADLQKFLRDVQKDFEDSQSGGGGIGAGRASELEEYRNKLGDLYEDIIELEEDRADKLDNAANDLKKAQDKINTAEEKSLERLEEKFQKQRDRYDDQIEAIEKRRDALIKASELKFAQDEAEDFLDMLEEISDPDFDKSSEEIFDEMIDEFARAKAEMGKSAEDIAKSLEPFKDVTDLAEAQRIEEFADAMQSLARADLDFDQEQAALAELQRQFREGEDANLEAFKVMIEDAESYAIRVNKERLEQMLADEQDIQDKITQSNLDEAAERAAIEQEYAAKRVELNAEHADKIERINKDINDRITKAVEKVTGKTSALFDRASKDAGTLRTDILNISSALINELSNSAQQGFDTLIGKIRDATQEVGNLNGALGEAFSQGSTVGSVAPPVNDPSQLGYATFSTGGHTGTRGGFVHPNEFVVPEHARQGGWGAVANFIASNDPMFREAGTYTDRSLSGSGVQINNHNTYRPTNEAAMRLQAKVNARRQLEQITRWVQR